MRDSNRQSLLVIYLDNNSPARLSILNALYIMTAHLSLVVSSPPSTLIFLATPSVSAVRGFVRVSSIVERTPSSSFGEVRLEEDAPGVSSSFFGLISPLESAGVTGKGEAAADEAAIRTGRL